VFFVKVFHAAQVFRVVLFRLPDFEANCLVVAETALFVDRFRIDTLAGGIGFGTGDKVCSGQIHSIESGEIEKGFVHDVNGSRLENDLVEDVNLMVKAIGDGGVRNFV
jgi:hypothetical protein